MIESKELAHLNIDHFTSLTDGERKRVVEWLNDKVDILKKGELEKYQDTYGNFSLNSITKW